MKIFYKILFCFIYLIVFIFHQIKCIGLLVSDSLYKNIQVINKDKLTMFIYYKENFGKLHLYEEVENTNNTQTILTENIELSYTSTFYQYIQYEKYNYFLYASYENNSNYNLKLILFDIQTYDENLINFVNTQFNIQNTSTIPSFDVIYASETTHFVFFGNNLYKYQIDFTLKEKTNKEAKQLSINSVSIEKSININNINLQSNSQSMINFDNSILMITYIYQNSSQNFIVTEIFDYSLNNLVNNGEVLSDTQSIIKIYKINDYKGLKTLKLNNKNILYFFVDNSQFYYSVKKITSNADNSITKYSLTDFANCYGLSGYCYSSLTNNCDVSNVEKYNIAIISENLFVVGCKSSSNSEIIIEIMKINDNENNDVNLNMKTLYILTYTDEYQTTFNQINLNVLSNRIFFLFFDGTYTYDDFMAP